MYVIHPGNRLQERFIAYMIIALIYLFIDINGTNPKIMSRSIYKMREKMQLNKDLEHLIIKKKVGLLFANRDQQRILKEIRCGVRSRQINE